MSTSFYTGLQSTTRKLLADKGQLVTLRRTDPNGAYDLATGKQALGEVTFSAYAVVLDFPAKEIDQTTVLRGDRKVLLEANASLPEPQVGDSVTVGGVVHAVTMVKVLRPAGVTVMYTLGIRVGG